MSTPARNAGRGFLETLRAGSGSLSDFGLKLVGSVLKRGKVGDRKMEEMQNRPDQEQQRKPWHAPAVRWLDVRDTKHSTGTSNDTGASGASLS